MRKLIDWGFEPYCIGWFFGYLVKYQNTGVQNDDEFYAIVRANFLAEDRLLMEISGALPSEVWA